MKKYIFILNAIVVMDKLFQSKSKRIEGVLYIDENTGKLTFKAYNRLSRQRQRDRLIEKLPWGWVKESLQRKKRFTSIPKNLPLAEQLAILDRENEMAKMALFEQELIGEDINL
ncbi:MAG: hypothetical protein K6G70_07400 [Bacteroidaceae bacterium]|nr:hypothetical protein [Bacteroidaceae bacterium]